MVKAARYQRKGYEHHYDTGQIVLSEKFGVGIIEGLRIRMGNPLYYVNPFNKERVENMRETKPDALFRGPASTHEVVVFEHEIIGVATSVTEAYEMAQGKGLI
jgi:hypothetical protein